MAVPSPDIFPMRKPSRQPAIVQLPSGYGTLIASLDLTKQGVLILEQAEMFAGSYLHAHPLRPNYSRNEDEMQVNRPANAGFRWKHVNQRGLPTSTR